MKNNQLCYLWNHTTQLRTTICIYSYSMIVCAFMLMEPWIISMGIIFTFWPQIYKLKMFPLYYCHLPVYHTFVSLLCQNSNIVQETNAKHICQAHKLINIYHIVFTVSSLTSALYNVIAFFVIFLSLCIMYVCYRLFVHFIQYTHVML